MINLFEPDQLYTVSEVAKKLRWSIQTIYRRVYLRTIPFIKLGDSRRSNVRFYGQDLNLFLDGNNMIKSTIPEELREKVEKATMNTVIDFDDYLDKLRKKEQN